MSKNNHYNPSLITTYTEQYFFLQNTYFPMPIFFPLSISHSNCAQTFFIFSLYIFLLAYALFLPPLFLFHSLQ